jgi:hypothetical protein
MHAVSSWARACHELAAGYRGTVRPCLEGRWLHLTLSAFLLVKAKGRLYRLGSGACGSSKFLSAGPYRPDSSFDWLWQAKLFAARALKVSEERRGGEEAVGISLEALQYLHEPLPWPCLRSN